MVAGSGGAIAQHWLRVGPDGWVLCDVRYYVARCYHFLDSARKSTNDWPRNSCCRTSYSFTGPKRDGWPVGPKMRYPWDIVTRTSPFAGRTDGPSARFVCGFGGFDGESAVSAPSGRKPGGDDASGRRESPSAVRSSFDRAFEAGVARQPLVLRVVGTRSKPIADWRRAATRR